MNEVTSIHTNEITNRCSLSWKLLAQCDVIDADIYDCAFLNFWMIAFIHVLCLMVVGGGIVVCEHV